MASGASDGAIAALAGANPSAQGARLRLGRGAPGIERLEAHFTGRPFALHRHDTYAIGVTASGVQTFHYRGERRHCLPGQGHVLHPDEPHDGAAGTDEGFGYRIMYVDPALVQQALGGAGLPYVADPILPRHAVARELRACLRDLNEPIGALEQVDVAVAVAAMLASHAGTRPRRLAPSCWPSLLRVRELLMEDPSVGHAAGDLERVAGLDRWTLARQFRAAFGTSPSRFRTMRRLDVARALLQRGVPIAAAALDAGFADQSHFSRKFKQAFGLTPARWLRAVRRGAAGRA